MAISEYSQCYMISIHSYDVCIKCPWNLFTVMLAQLNREISKKFVKYYANFRIDGICKIYFDENLEKIVLRIVYDSELEFDLKAIAKEIIAETLWAIYETSWIQWGMSAPYVGLTHEDITKTLFLEKT